MDEGWVLWLFLVGLALGGVVTWLLTWRLPRGEADVSEAERPAEAAWISTVIERHGGIAPRSLVEEVLDLHQVYLQRGWAPDARAMSAPSRSQGPAVGYTLMPPPGSLPGPATWRPGPPRPVDAGPEPASPGSWSPPPPVNGMRAPVPGSGVRSPSAGDGVPSSPPEAGIQPPPRSQARRPT